MLIDRNVQLNPSTATIKCAKLYIHIIIILYKLYMYMYLLISISIYWYLLNLIIYVIYI